MEVSTYGTEHLGSIPGVEKHVSVLCHSKTDFGAHRDPNQMKKLKVL